MPLVLAGATSGQATLQATDAQTVTITLPATSGTLVTTGGAQTIEFADGSAAAPSITNSGDTNTGMFFPAADTIAFSEGGVESMRIDSAGLVGIGCTPVTNLQVNSSSDVGIAMSNSSSVTSGNRGSFSMFNSGNSTCGYIRFGAVTDNVGTDIQFANRPAGGSLTERMRIDSAGNVGIGRTNPSARLHVQAATVSADVLLATNSNNRGLNLNTNASDNLQISHTNSNFNIDYWVSGTGVHTFSTAGTERMRIDSSGNVIVGKNNTGFDNTGMYINSVGQTISTMTNNADSGGANFYMNRRGVNGTVCLFYKDSVSVGSISVTGSATAYVTSSDYRLKEDIAPMTNALATVSALKPVTYKWKTDGSNGQGFIAHELQAIVPDCVTGEKDAMRTEKYEVSPAIPATFDEEGNELTPAVEAVMGEREVPDYQGIDTSFLVATLTCAIQEQQALITQLQADVAALKGAA